MKRQRILCRLALLRLMKKAIKKALKTIKTPEHDFTQEVKSKIHINSR